MSNKVPKKTNELAQVLNRVNILMGHAEAQAESTIQVVDIPELTEVYEGESLNLISHTTGEFPTLSDIVGESALNTEMATAEDLEQTELQRAESLETFLTEVAPLIHDTINRAVLQKVIEAEEPLLTKIEEEIMLVLRERLQSLHSDDSSDLTT